jgi:hypothetical protein
MRATFATMMAILVVTCVSGCARFAFYSDANLSGVETGVKFYTPKPYLLVARTGSKDKPNDISVIYIPDLSHPIYAKPMVGIGANNLTLALSNGILTTLGQQTDSKIPELLTALGGFATSVATARKTSREASLLTPQAAPDYSQVSIDLAKIASDLSNLIAQGKATKTLTELEMQAATGIVNALTGASQLLSDPTKAELNVPSVVVNLKSALDIWSKQIQEASAGTKGIELQIRSQITTLKGKAQQILSKLAPMEPGETEFSLYEIDNSSGVTILREMKF